VRSLPRITAGHVPKCPQLRLLLGVEPALITPVLQTAGFGAQQKLVSAFGGSGFARFRSLMGQGRRLGTSDMDAFWGVCVLYVLTGRLMGSAGCRAARLKSQSAKRPHATESAPSSAPPWASLRFGSSVRSPLRLSLLRYADTNSVPCRSMACMIMAIRRASAIFALRIVDLKIVWGQSIIDRHQDRTDMRNRVVCLRMSVRVWGNVGDTIAFSDIEGLESRRPPVAAFQELCVGESQIPVNDRRDRRRAGVHGERNLGGSVAFP
jgi:hypothetical protein